jgi:hypothetical protein
MPRDGLRLSAELLNRCAAVFDRHPRYSVADQAIKKVLAVFPSNSNLPDVIAKVGLIKTLYATPIYDVFGIAERICAYRENGSRRLAFKSFSLLSPSANLDSASHFFALGQSVVSVGVAGRGAPLSTKSV